MLIANSAHPKPLIRTIPYGQYLWLRRNCSSDSEFRRESELLRERGYSHRLLKQAFNKVANRNRQELLLKAKSPKDSTTTRFITKFNTGHQCIKDILSEYWYILSDNESIAKHITSYLSITYTRSTSVRDRLVHSAFQLNVSKLDDPPGLFRCGTCNICPWISEGHNFSLHNGSNHQVRQHISCKTMGIIYLLKCTCGAFYVGKTNPSFHRRIMDHLYDISVGRLNKPTCRHEGLHHKNDSTEVTSRALEHIPQLTWGGDWDACI